MRKILRQVRHLEGNIGIIIRIFNFLQKNLVTVKKERTISFSLFFSLLPTFFQKIKNFFQFYYKNYAIVVSARCFWEKIFPKKIILTVILTDFKEIVVSISMLVNWENDKFGLINFCWTILKCFFYILSCSWTLLILYFNQNCWINFKFNVFKLPNTFCSRRKSNNNKK